MKVAVEFFFLVSESNKIDCDFGDVALSRDEIFRFQYVGNRWMATIYRERGGQLDKDSWQKIQQFVFETVEIQIFTNKTAGLARAVRTSSFGEKLRIKYCHLLKSFG